jgi:tetratricopeptide (TPR) repeat protein
MQSEVGGGARMLTWAVRGLLVAAPLATTGCTQMMASGQNANGVRMHQQGQYQAAVERFQQAIVTDPMNGDGYYNLAATYHQLGKQQNNESYLQQAETLYNQCLDRNANHRDCYRGLAVLLVEENRPEDAVKLVEGWSQRAPMLADPKIEMARLQEELGDKEAALKHLQDALAVEPSNTRALTALGHVQEELGNASQALANYQRAMQLDRWNPDLQARTVALQTGMTNAPLTASAAPAATTTQPRTVTRPGKLPQ